MMGLLGRWGGTWLELGRRLSIERGRDRRRAHDSDFFVDRGGAVDTFYHPLTFARDGGGTVSG